MRIVKPLAATSLPRPAAGVLCAAFGCGISEGPRLGRYRSKNRSTGTPIRDADRARGRCLLNGGGHVDADVDGGRRCVCELRPAVDELWNRNDVAGGRVAGATRLPAFQRREHVGAGDESHLARLFKEQL